MKENTPPSKARRRVFGLSPINETPEREATCIQLLAENKGLKRKLLEYEKDINDLRQKVARMENNPYYLEVINLAKNANLPLDDVTLPPGTTPPPVDLSSFTDMRHPFQNDLILLEVFRYLGSEDLLRCRLVNRQWTSNTTPHFRNAHPYIGFASVQKVTEFVRTARNSPSFPFSRFLIQNRFVSGMATQFGFFAPFIKDLRLISASACSRHKHSVNLHSIIETLKTMTNLDKLEITSLSFPKVFPDTLQAPTFTIPSLKTLRIDANFIEIEGLDRLAVIISQNPKSNQIVQHLFRIAPLKKVSLGISGFSIIPMFLEPLALLPSLEELEVTSILVEPHLRSLLKTPKPFALKSLKLILQLQTCQILVRFLEAHACSLETLELHLGANRGHIFTTPRVEFPKFPNLRNLKLISSFNGSQFPFRQSPDGGEFPSLSKLHLSNDVSPGFLTWSRILNFINVEDLTYTNNPYYEHNHRARGPLDEIESVFPTVKKVTLITSNAKDLQGVVVKFPNLEFLQFGPIGNITETLTGIPEPAWTDGGLPLECDVNSVSKYFAVHFLQRTAASKGCGLHLLKNLKRLEIKGQAEGNSGIKDTLGYGVLLALPRLEYLVITNSELSEPCINELRRHHQNVIFKSEPTQRYKRSRYAFDMGNYRG